MDSTDFLGTIVGMLFDALGALASILIAPVDLLVNALVPSATTAVSDFFTWANTMLAGMLDFVNWFFYVLGITPATWGLFTTVLLTLLLVWIFLFPFKLIMSTFRGLRQ